MPVYVTTSQVKWSTLTGRHSTSPEATGSDDTIQQLERAMYYQCQITQIPFSSKEYWNIVSFPIFHSVGCSRNEWNISLIAFSWLLQKWMEYCFAFNRLLQKWMECQSLFAFSWLLQKSTECKQTENDIPFISEATNWIRNEWNIRVLLHSFGCFRNLWYIRVWLHSVDCYRNEWNNYQSLIAFSWLLINKWMEYQSLVAFGWLLKTFWFPTVRALCRTKLLPVTRVLVDTWMSTVKAVKKN